MGKTERQIAGETIGHARISIYLYSIRVWTEVGWYPMVSEFENIGYIKLRLLVI